MSYCREGDDSDVYVYRSNQSADLPFVVHVGGGPGKLTGTREETALYLLQLRADGVKVPQRALDRINQGR